ncbi:von Willebrand factor C and EGF domain-containing protein isoform X1 [Drosophila santomea]|uniref:von Willebrand factor C and EGF domain-containing protein isoform X1 n=2 Tax=Drosophila santomea TaxID=129105 RepID=UPI0019535178|nr:von Willebrand factor C and EGF domain-containing protein isoform X1 [Drosophila santomea]XP_039487637.1 von Willebrand factor C and EGF domain-containing protein isoform X1 [Drosophila santomea]
MAKLIIICLLLRILNSCAMPIIDPDSIDDSLMCPPCENDFPTCYKVIVEVERGNGLPGSCCPRYECLDEEPVCDGSKRRFYKNKCTVCDPCEPLAIQCKEICPMEELEPICLTDNNEYKRKGDVWMENDGCTTCTCEDGYVSCSAIQCNHIYSCSNPIKVKGICCLICPEELGVSNDIFGDSTHKYRNSTSAPISEESESSSSESSSTVPTDTSDSVPSTNSSASSPSTSSEMATSTPNTSEVSGSTENSSTDSSDEQLGGSATSESPDRKPDSEEQETSSDSPIETTTNPTTSDDLETFSVSSTFMELPTSTEDGITKMSFNADNRTPKAIDEPTVILVTASNFSVATDNPFTNQPAVGAPESTSQIKDLNSMEIQQITYPYAEVPQEHIQTDWPWECVVVMVLVIFLVLIFLYAIVKRYSISKKYHAIPLNPVRKLNETEKTKAEQKL